MRGEEGRCGVRGYVRGEGRWVPGGGWGLPHVRIRRIVRIDSEDGQ